MSATAAVLSDSEAGTHGGPASLPGSYVAAGTLGMFFWDFVIHLEEEYKLFLKQKISLPTVAYFCCRLSTLSGLIAGTIFFGPALDRFCFGLNSTMIVTTVSIMTSTSTLLLFCVRAFYMGKKPVIAVFSLSFFLILVIGVAATFYGVIEKNSLPRGSHFCMHTTPPGQPETIIIQVAILVWLTNNIAVFIAIAVRLIPDDSAIGTGGDVHHSEWEKVATVRRILRGDHLPEFSRTLWLDCQRYIVAFTFTSIAIIVVFSIRILPDVYGFVVIGPHLAIQNCMISYLVRNIRAASLNSARNMEISRYFLTSSDSSSSRDPG